MAPSRVGREAGHGRDGRTVKSEMLAGVRAAIAIVLRQKGYVSVLDVLVEMKRLTPAHLEDWRFGRVPYLERVIEGNLSKLSLIGREVRNVAQAQGLTPSVTFHRRWGKGPKRALRFSKSGDPSVELAYATQWVSERGRARRPWTGARKGCRRSGMAERFPPMRPGRRLRPNDRRTSCSRGCRSCGTPTGSRSWPPGSANENSDLRAFLKWEGPPPKLVDRLFHRLQAEVSAEIDCTECARCCRELSPVLKAKDVERLARRLRVPNPEFRKAHLREDGEGLVFARTPCPLLDGIRCSCYRDRPEDCRSYPHLHKKGMTRRLLGVLENAGVCPIAFTVLERLKAELLERGHDWRAGSTISFPA